MKQIFLIKNDVVINILVTKRCKCCRIFIDIFVFSEKKI